MARRTDDTDLELADIKVNDFGGSPVADHNMPCPVCGKNKATLDLNADVFHPCWECKSKGWETRRRREGLWSRLLQGGRR